MTEKELLYVEDVLGHEQYLQSQCCDTSDRISDRELKSFADEIQQKHRQIFHSFYDLL